LRPHRNKRAVGWCGRRGGIATEVRPCPVPMHLARCDGELERLGLWAHTMRTMSRRTSSVCYL
jgi:hypothetical protein